MEINLDESTLKEQLRSLISDYSDCFVNPADGKLGLTDLMECKIETLPGTTPVCKYSYHLTPAMREEMDKIPKRSSQKGIIEESLEGVWTSMPFLSKSLVVDYSL